jgi:RimJ/RimL family protein N-acetyltransferase
VVASPRGAHRSLDSLAEVSNRVDQPLGEALEWRAARRPERREHRGAHVVVRPLNPESDTEPLYALSHAPTGDPSIWTYLYEQPFADVRAYRDHLEARAAGEDPLFFVIADAQDGRPLGQVTYMSIEPEHGSIELGNIWFSPELQRTPAATEAIFLLAAHAFDELGYRRLEWKCNALNAPSRDAALRYGFVYEGTFRQHRVVKGRNRDSAWFALTDRRWPAVRAAFESWLAPANFGPDGAQARSLRELTVAIAAN